MARLRTLKPGFFKNELLAEVEPLGRLLFEGLWTIADKRGRLEDRPKRIKAEVLPYDDADVSDLLTQLEDRGFIIRYQVDGEAYIQVTNFEKHQHPHVREPESEIPAPDKHSASTVQDMDEHLPSTADIGLPLTDIGELSSVNGESPESSSAIATEDSAPKGADEYSDVWPEWYSLLWGVEGFKASLELAEAWREKNQIPEKLALEKAYALRDWWPRQTPRKRKDGNPYATWQHWCQRDKGQSARASPNGRATRIERDFSDLERYNH